jgi:DNA-binding NtrC family response regulator
MVMTFQADFLLRKAIMNQTQTEPIKATILIVDDIPANLNLLREALEPEGYEILGAPSGEIALQIANRTIPDLILLDIVMPGLDGFETCRRLKGDPKTADIPVIFITIKDEVEDIVKGFQVGGVDYITKSCQKEELLARVRTHLKISQLTQMYLEANMELTAANQELQEEIAKREREEQARQQAENALLKAEDALLKADEKLSLISEQEASHWGIEGFVGKSRTIAAILDNVRQLQNTGATSVLITGESGTGKELIARAIHFGGTRAKGPFHALNCSAIPGELAESYIFGHVRGAFTGANTSRKGYFELADGGTLFLDEIGDMPLELQPKLLRVLEDGCFTPVGGAAQKRVDVRILAATNQNLDAKIAAGKFRQDLYYRLARFTVFVPPLRQRKEDIPLLTEHFLSMFAQEMTMARGQEGDLLTTSSLSPKAMEALMNYPFPGNIRELRNIIERALILSCGGVIQPEHLQITSVDGSVLTKTESARTQPPHDDAEQLMLERAQTEDEEKILAYIRQRGSINNTQCRDLLGVDNRRATYLLQKLMKYGLLVHKGKQRWSRYLLKS